MRYGRCVLILAMVLSLSGCAARSYSSDQSPSAIPLVHKNGLHYVDVKINGNAARLLVDTGASITLLNHKFDGLAGTAQGEVQTVSGQVKAQRAQIHLLIGTRAFAADALIGDFRITDADGSLGSDVLNACGIVTFDYVNEVMLLYRRP